MHRWTTPIASVFEMLSFGTPPGHAMHHQLPRNTRTNKERPAKIIEAPRAKKEQADGIVAR